MPIEITVRHLTLKESVQDHAREMAEKLVADFPMIEYVHIVFDTEGNDYAVELKVQGGQASTEAKATDPDATAAVNALFDKAYARLRRDAQKRQEVRK